MFLRIELQQLYRIAADRRGRSFLYAIKRPHFAGLQLANIAILTGPEKGNTGALKQFSAALEKQRDAAWIVKNSRILFKAFKGR